MAVNAQAYFAANPDVAASFASNNYGMTADEFANFHFANYGASESRTPPTGVTNEQILTFLKDNPNLTDEQIVSSMKTYGISPSQMAGAVGLNEGEIASRVAATVPPGSSIILGDTIIVPQYQTTGSGMDQQVGALETFYTSKTTGDVNYRAPVGSEYQQYGADGTFQRTGTTQAVAGSFLEGLGEALTDPVVLAALAGGYGAGLFGGAGAAGAATVGSTGLTMAELAQLDLALGGAGGTLGAETLATALTTGAAVPTLTNLTGGSGTTPGLLTPPTTPVTTPVTPPVTPTTPVAPPVTPPVVPPVVPPVIPPVTPSVIPSVIPSITPSVIPPALTTALTSLIPSAVNTVLNPTNLSGLLTSGATTAAGLLQQQTSRDAAIAAQAMIDRETDAAKQAAAFRPVGMTTRFGTSQFQVDPVTGQLTSAGYTLSPEAKAQQDRFMALSQQGLTQAEAAQGQYAPLQTGAQNLFNLGNQYIAQSPESVAQNYLNQQMALLQPGRELELANLQNKLQQQGRGGLSVAQGGTLGATTPELQALYNARAQQEAQLAAQAQQAGQQQVLYGAGLLGQGTTAMGNYYAGQQAAYAPYTTAMGQVTGLEALAQQPLTMGANLGQTAAQAGFNVGQLGLRGAGASVELATGKAATTNPYSTAISGLAANPAFGQYVGGLLSPTAPVTAMSAPATTFGTGNYYGQQDLGLFL